MGAPAADRGEEEAAGIMNHSARGRGRVAAREYVTVRMLPDFAEQIVGVLTRAIERLPSDGDKAGDREGLELLCGAIKGSLINWIRG